MGDNYRSLVLAEYITRHFPPPIRVADVAGGNGTLNDILSVREYEVVTFDPNLRMKYPNRKGQAVRFYADIALAFDLVVGMHPDQATEEIVYATKHCPIIVVPCCNFWIGREMPPSRSIRGTIERYLHFKEIPFVKERLEITGPNIVYRTF